MPGKEKNEGINELEKMADGTGREAKNAQKALENMGFRMQMGSKSATNSDSAFAMKDESNIYMSALFNAGHGGAPNHTHPSTTIPTVTVEKSSSSTNVDGGSSNNSSSSQRTNFSSDPEERAKQKEWIKNNPEKYKELIDAKKNQSSNNVSNESSSSSKNISLSDKSESDILGEQESVTNTNMSMIDAIDLKAKNQRISDSIAGRNKYVNKLNFQDFKSSNTPGTPQYNFANKVGSAYGAANEASSGYSSFSESLSKSKDSDGKPLFTSPGDFVKTVYETSDRPGTRRPRMNSRDFNIAEKVSKSLGKSWDVNETMKSLREEQSNLSLNMQLPEGALKFYNRDK